MTDYQTEAPLSFPAFPLRVGPTYRYLVDQQGEPVWLQGDTAWSLISGLTENQVEQYLVDRHKKGFNAIIVNLIEHKFNGPLNRYGEGPFRVPGDFSTPNEAYFGFADRCMDLAAQHGIQVFLAPIYLGSAKPSEDEGWYLETLANGVEKCHEYGRYVGKRYGRFDNLVWLMGGDRNPGAALNHVNAVAQGIKEMDARHLFTAHTAPEDSPVAEYQGGGWLTLNATYTYQIVHRRLLADYNREPAMPFFLIESTYEGEHNASAVQIRRQAYWAILCGAAGQFIGNRPIWGFFSDWQSALESTASQQMVYLQKLVSLLPWHRLIPDQAHRLVTKGLGESRGMDALTAAYTDDKLSAVAYMPSARAIVVDFSQLAGERVLGCWFNPRTGQVHFAGEFPLRGCPTLYPPDQGDWVLVLDNTAVESLTSPG
jgi:hypothetical protein